MEAVTEKKPTIAAGRKPVRLAEGDHIRHVWVISVAPDVTLDVVRQPEFWSHVAANLSPCDRIEVMPEDMSWFAELMVLEADRVWAKTAVMRFVELAGADVDVTGSGFKVEYKGPEKKHCVIRESDKQILQEGIAKKADAQAWIVTHLKTVGR
jgi:hypothetical protein